MASVDLSEFCLIIVYVKFKRENVNGSVNPCYQKKEERGYSVFNWKVFSKTRCKINWQAFLRNKIGGKIIMNAISSHVIVLYLLKEALESEGCQLAEIDFENLLIKVDGPDEVLGNCARAVSEILE